MAVGALLKSLIYVIASSLLYPVLVLLVLLTAWIVVQAGGLVAEWLERVRLKPLSPGDVSEEEPGGAGMAHRVRAYLNDLGRILPREGERVRHLDIENLLRERVHHARRGLDRVRMVVRIGPSLGLIGTLIPMGTGLAALGQGDLSRLSSDLVIAFTTTVVGLAVGIVAYVFYTLRRRWVEEDIKNMQLVTEVLAGAREEEGVL
ncbi:MAG: MotA/TolQ/ExbB proton channel family protein [Desulfobacteraceae bacterium]|jgi:biopolymer transport protein ExbB/TolQ